MKMIGIILSSLMITIFISIARVIVQRKYEKVYNSIKSGVFTSEQYLHILHDKTRFLNLNDDGQNKFLNTFFVSKDIEMKFSSMEYKIYKRALDIEQSIGCTQDKSIEIASQKLSNEQLLFTNNISYNAYLILGANNFYELPSKNHSLPILIPIINRHSLNLILSRKSHL